MCVWCPQLLVIKQLAATSSRGTRHSPAADAPLRDGSAISNQNNKARLQLLEKREELLEQVFEDAKSKIGQVTKDEKKYSALLKNLVLQVCAPPPAMLGPVPPDLLLTGRARRPSIRSWRRTSRYLADRKTRSC